MREKLAEFDSHVDDAFDDLLNFIVDHEQAIKALARGRLVTGHFIYGEGLMFEFDPNRLDKERIEEIADAVNYSYARLTKL